jgi:hypothetical protein
MKSTQLALSLAPFQKHSDTSRDAAAKILPAVGTLRRKVLEALQAVGSQGMTDEELQSRLNLTGSTQRPRRIELVAAGLVIDSGQRRPAESGRSAVVWVSASPA